MPCAAFVILLLSLLLIPSVCYLVQIQNELEMVQQGKKMSEIVKRFQTVKMVFHAAKFFNRDCTFFVRERAI